MIPIVKPQTTTQYQYLYFKHMDFYAKRNGLDKPDRKLTPGEIREMFNDVCEEVRQLYQLTATEHAVYKEMMTIIVFGKNKGRKGKLRDNAR
jgi:hypothetical protein